LGQSVALKFLPQRVAEDPTWLRRFRNEVRTARQIAHPNVCRIYDIAEVDGHVFLSMEYIDGEDLAGVLRRLGRPSAEKAIELARQICLGLAAAHENGVLHRDLKPPNIMIDGRGRARITDFGIAGFIEELEDAPARAGTPAYMAPEQLTRGEVSVRSDIYTLGLILHELFTGNCVFDTDDVEELKRQHTSGSVTTPSSVTTEIDPAVERVIRRCLEQQPQQRPQSVYQVLAALPGGDPVAAALAAGETPSPEMIASARGRGGLRPAVALTLLALCVAAVIVGAVAIDGSVVMPDKGPHVLSVEAAQVMARLGHTDLPANSAAGFAPINRRPQPGSDAEPTATNGDWPPNYRYWRRWANGSLEPSNFHMPYAVTPNDPPMSRPGDALVELDSSGRLLRVDVIPDTEAEPLGETDWGAALALLGVAGSDAEPTEPVRKPRRPVDEFRAWKVDLAPGAVVQAGAVGGRIVSFQVIEPLAERTPPPQDSAAFVITTILSIVAKVVMIILAVQNVRMRRSDLAAAVRLALVMAALEFVIELLSIRFAERPLLNHIETFFQQRTAGHIAMHALTIFVAYVAIEPYARRLWPRLLVGSAPRSASCSSR
ncbi:MAG: serine/threonine-protein kinase, partial [Planctomycetota bacterium]